jgi:hypothetical protein
MGKAIFDSVKSIIHVAAQFIGRTINSVKAPVHSIKPAVYRVKPLVHIYGQFAHVMASRVPVQVFSEQFFH